MTNKQPIQSDAVSELTERIRTYYARPDVVEKYSAQAHGHLSALETYLINTYCTDCSQVVLNVGCAAGRELHAFLDRNFHVVNVDVCEQLIQQAVLSVNARNRADRAEFMCGDICTITLPAASYAYVYFGGQTLGNIMGAANRAKALATVHAAMKAGGVMLLSVHNRYGTVLRTLFFLLKLFLWQLARCVSVRPRGEWCTYVNKRIPTYYCSCRELRRQLTRAGFTNVTVMTQHAFQKRIGIAVTPKSRHIIWAVAYT